MTDLSLFSDDKTADTSDREAFCLRLLVIERALDVQRHLIENDHIAAFVFPNGRMVGLGFKTFLDRVSFGNI